jgi:prephenate dehydrogenase
MQFERLALIGCGLMGGSFALALRQAGLVQHVCGYSASEGSRAKALQMGVIDQTCTSVGEAVQGADLVLLAVPVAATPSCLQQMQPAVRSDALVMDVGSTKADVVAAALATLGERLNCFVPAHPIAGKEVAGIAHADAALYQARQVILTPLTETPANQTARARQVWQALGAQVIELSPQDHDAAFAAVSHLPHLLAFAFINAIAQQAEGAQYLSMAGTGFRDFSRIAASAPEVWRDILLANQTQVLHQSKLMRQALSEFEQAMHSGDALRLEALIQNASLVRSQWSLGGTPCND